MGEGGVLYLPYRVAVRIRWIVFKNTCELCVEHGQGIICVYLGITATQFLAAKLLNKHPLIEGALGLASASLQPQLPQVCPGLFAKAN